MNLSQATSASFGLHGWQACAEGTPGSAAAGGARPRKDGAADRERAAQRLQQRRDVRGGGPANAE
ncbi:MAG: hypothetical protein MUQ56_10035, partial [Thermoleophilia bacterium]|nr:hypothetical protein [Thermoleophilia bacterium]